MSETTAGRPPADDVTDDDLRVTPPKQWAAGIPGIWHATSPAVAEMGVGRTARALLNLNQKHGFDCMSCAWPDPEGRRKTAEFCENGAKAITWEADPRLVPDDFWAEYSTSTLLAASEYWLGQQGRLARPVIKDAGSDHYRVATWEEAYRLIGAELRALDTPDAAAFYTSGRASNEAAFVYQLFVRAFGTNNLPDCSNLCHESSGVAMTESLGVGKSTVRQEDYARADLIIVMGQNPGTNHPRMLGPLAECKENGGSIVAVNPLPEAGLKRFKDPQRVDGIVGQGTEIADQLVQVRLGGDLALLQLVVQRVLRAEERAPGTVLDHEFIAQHTSEFDDYREHVLAQDEDALLRAAGVRAEDVDELAERYIAADRVIITWAMGLTQHVQAVDTIQEIINLLLLRGNMGRPGAGASPIRGHSNVQGNRSMGIYEKMDDAFLDRLGAEFSFEPPRDPGVDAIGAVRGMRDGRISAFFALGGNFLSAMSDTGTTAEALGRCRLTVQVSTKLNRSHGAVGEIAVILPCRGRSEIDEQASGRQWITTEDTASLVQPSFGRLTPVADTLKSETEIVCEIARAVLGADHPIDWEGLFADYDTIRGHIGMVAAGCQDYQRRTSDPGGFVMDNGARERRWRTATGRARFHRAVAEEIDVPPGRLLLQTLRSHDQFNTTIYGLDDRYRGIHQGRRVVFVNPADLADLGFADGDRVDLVSEYRDQIDLHSRNWRLVAYPTARGCAAAYYPEANELVHLDHVARRSNTPVSKAVVVRFERR